MALARSRCWPASRRPGAAARPAGADTDGRPNILVVMTDDMASTDLQFMPNVRKLLAEQGTKFTDAVDSFPLCCPARATFITGQYAHNHGVGGQLLPLRLVRDEGPRQHPPRLAAEGRLPHRADRQVAERLRRAATPTARSRRGFDIWRGLLDVSAYDYYNFVMNRDGKLQDLGRPGLRPQAGRVREHRGDPNPGGLAGVLAKLAEVFGPRARTTTGAPRSRRTTRPT